jgi:polar amino acid transport system ATP-binding protein
LPDASLSPTTDTSATEAAVKPAVDVRGIAKRFGELSVLEDVSLTVHRGRTVGVLGPSGSGKSTLLRCINWLEEPDEGEIYIAGKRIGFTTGVRGNRIAMSARELARMRARVVMVFQAFNLWPHLTVLQNVIEAPVHVRGLPRDQAVAEAEGLLVKVGLADKRDVFPYQLSGGQKQRVAIARALAMAPDVLLFDEPTSALDPELVGEVLKVMRDLAAEHMTMIVVTHEMAFARDACDEIVFMDQGRVVERAEPATFFTAPASERSRQFLARLRQDDAASV